MQKKTELQEKNQKDEKSVQSEGRLKTPIKPMAVLFGGGSIEQRNTLRRDIIKDSYPSVISVILNQEETAGIVFALSSNESIVGLTFEQAEQLIGNNSLKYPSTEIMRQLTSEKRSGRIDLGPIPSAERHLIPEYIIDSSQQELIEKTIQVLCDKLFSHTKFTLKKGSSGYEFIYEESTKSMEEDTDKLIGFNIRLSMASSKSFYINETNIAFLGKLAKNIPGGKELIKPLQVKSKWWQLPLDNKKSERVISEPVKNIYGAYAVTSSSYTPGMYAPSESKLRKPELTLPKVEELNTVLGKELVTGVTDGIFSSEAMIISFNKKFETIEIQEKFGEALLKGIEGVKVSKSSYSSDLCLLKKDYAMFMENLGNALKKVQEPMISSQISSLSLGNLS